MPSLAGHANVFETCLQILTRRGYALSMTPAEDDGPGFGTFEAERDGFTFWADNPIELLGLVALYEELGPADDRPYWWGATTDDSDVWGRLRDEAEARQAARHAELEALRARDPAAWQAEVRRAFDDGYDQTNAASFLNVTRAELRRILEAPELADLRARPPGPVRPG
jgi:hypothetical protein